MARSIYTDAETEGFIKGIKEKDPEFNLSSWFKVKIKESGGGDEESIVELSNKLEEAKIKESEAQAQQEYFRQKIAQVQLKQNNEQSRIEFEKKRESDRLNERKRNFLIFAPQLFKLTKGELDEYSNEFVLQDEDIPTFLENKGKQVFSPTSKKKTPLFTEKEKSSSQFYDELMNLKEDVKGG